MTDFSLVQCTLHWWKDTCWNTLNSRSPEWELLNSDDTLILEFFKKETERFRLCDTLARSERSKINRDTCNFNFLWTEECFKTGLSVRNNLRFEVGVWKSLSNDGSKSWIYASGNCAGKVWSDSVFITKRHKVILIRFLIPCSPSRALWGVASWAAPMGLKTVPWVQHRKAFLVVQFRCTGHCRRCLHWHAILGSWPSFEFKIHPNTLPFCLVEYPNPLPFL